MKILSNIEMRIIDVKTNSLLKLNLMSFPQSQVLLTCSRSGDHYPVKISHN